MAYVYIIFSSYFEGGFLCCGVRYSIKFVNICPNICITIMYLHYWLILKHTKWKKYI